ncbi:MAG: hypothetical protein AB7S81_07520 [Bdellovibrionales bacterium]
MAKGIKTGGRKAGTPNKATQEIKEAARKYAPDALMRLHEILLNSESDAAKVSAAREILDRAYGKASQAISTDSVHVVQMPTIKIDGKNFDIL